MDLGRFLAGLGRQGDDDTAMPESERSESVRQEAADALDARPTDLARVPPGQWVTRGWPVLTYGSTPRFDAARWDLRIVGMVENPLAWDYETFMGLPTKKVLCDIHCVTTWSLLDNVFEGVPALYVAEQAKIKPNATHVIVHAEQGYTANLPLADFLRDDVLLAYKHNGENLALDHGWPLRLMVPTSTFGRAPSGCAAWSSSTPTSPASGSNAAITCAATLDRRTVRVTCRFDSGHRH